MSDYIMFESHLSLCRFGSVAVAIKNTSNLKLQIIIQKMGVDHVIPLAII